MLVHIGAFSVLAVLLLGSQTGRNSRGDNGPLCIDTNHHGHRAASATRGGAAAGEGGPVVSVNVASKLDEHGHAIVRVLDLNVVRRHALQDAT